ncbi:MAG: LCP family protein [Acutalibacteraceae bacterium]|nr:LCP family protein [Acutalibacteraceae bacterium]
MREQREITINLNDINGKNNEGGKHSKEKGKMTLKKKIVLLIVAVLLAACIVAGILLWPLIDGMLNHKRDDSFNDKDTNVNILTQELFKEKYINIALFGLDNRSNQMSGRSDAVIILTIDRVHNKIKMTSLARDSYVKMDGHGQDKLTHAYAFGRAQLAVRTLNQNYDMDITDYVTVNFFQMVDLIDYVGGVEIDVDASEMSVMNTHYVNHLNKIGIPCKRITKTGKQLLTGSQALAYTRNRYSPGGDVERGNRQKEVLMAAYEKMMASNVFKLSTAVGMLLKNCETSLSNAELLELGTWAVKNSPTIESISLPDEDCNARGQTINKVWQYVYDLDIATQKIHDFIKEEGTYIKEEETSEPTSSTTSN